SAPRRRWRLPVVVRGELPDKTMFASLVMATRAVRCPVAGHPSPPGRGTRGHPDILRWRARLPGPERRPLCSGGMRGRNPEHFGQSLSRRGKWIIGAICAGALVIFAGVGVWSGLHQGSYDQSRNGCINLSVVSSTGGAVIH